MAFGVKTNERPGTRAELKYARFSAYKAREVLNLIRGRHVADAINILALTERGAAEPILKLLNSAIANAVNNDGIAAEELYVSACFADEGPTLKRFRPRARGRAGRIRKRTTHITIIVSRMDGEQLAILRAKANRAPSSARSGASRAQRVAKSRAGSAPEPEAEVIEADAVEAEVVDAEAEVAEAEVAEAVEAESVEADDAETEVADSDAAETDDAEEGEK